MIILIRVNLTAIRQSDSYKKNVIAVGKRVILGTKKQSDSYTAMTAIHFLLCQGTFFSIFTLYHNPKSIAVIAVIAVKPIIRHEIALFLTAIRQSVIAVKDNVIAVREVN